MAANGLVAVKGATGHNWRALEYIRANGLDEGVRLVRTEPGGEDCKRFLIDLSPSILMGDASRKPAKQGPRGMATLAKDIMKAFIHSTARGLLLECHPNLLRSTEWGQAVIPALREAACTVETVELAASRVGVLSGKRKAFAVGTRRGKPGGEGERLREWRRELERRDSRRTSLREFLSRRGTYFLKREMGERGIFSLDNPIMSITRAHVMGEKPLRGTYRPHPLDVGEIDQAGELSFAEYKRLTTGRADYCPNRQQGSSSSDTGRLCLTSHGERGSVRVVGEGAAGERNQGGAAPRNPIAGRFAGAIRGGHSPSQASGYEVQSGRS